MFRTAEIKNLLIFLDVRGYFLAFIMGIYIILQTFVLNTCDLLSSNLKRCSTSREAQMRLLRSSYLLKCRAARLKGVLSSIFLYPDPWSYYPEP